MYRRYLNVSRVPAVPGRVAPRLSVRVRRACAAPPPAYRGLEVPAFARLRTLVMSSPTAQGNAVHAWGALVMSALIWALAIDDCDGAVAAAVDLQINMKVPIPVEVAVAPNASAPERHAAAELVQMLANISAFSRAFAVVEASSVGYAASAQIAVGWGAATQLGVPAMLLDGLGREGFLAR
eukprot:SAG31_NODE_2521_length_5566_cov_2.201939_6_plen_181_part_00